MHDVDVSPYDEGNKNLLQYSSTLDVPDSVYGQFDIQTQVTD